MTFPAFLDTCTLYSSTLTDTLLRIAEERAFRSHWSAEILDELGRALVREAGVTDTQARRRLQQMQRAFPDAEVTGHDGLIDAMTLGAHGLPGFGDSPARRVPCGQPRDRMSLNK
jgi:hypothetical protein